MALSKKQQFKRKAERSMLGLGKLSTKRLEKLLRASFSALNNKSVYKFFQDESQRTFHNLMDFLYIFEIYLEKVYGKKKKYGKKKTEKALEAVLVNPSRRQVKTINKIKKVYKKPKNKKLAGFKFKFGKKTQYQGIDEDMLVIVD
jgi:hypothetical protein